MKGHGNEEDGTRRGGDRVRGFEGRMRGIGDRMRRFGDRIRAWWGLVRSFLTYWRPGRQRGLRRLYRPFVAPGDLVFDVGAHLGDRTAAFRALGARVVALEPQPRPAAWLERLVGRWDEVTILHEAAGAEPGTAELAVSPLNPTVSTLATEFRDRVPERNPTFRGVRWDRSVEVTVTTLDRLIETHGRPSFVKIDVEGFEADVLAGLSQPLRALSVEFVSGGLKVATACVDRLETLGSYEYNAVRGERRDFLWPEWRSAAAVRGWFTSGADGLSSGDLYARRTDPPPTNGPSTSLSPDAPSHD